MAGALCRRSLLIHFVFLGLFVCLSCVQRGATNESVNKPDAVRPRAFATPDARVNINTATPEELARLPALGPKLAGDIVEHRVRFGPFRRIEHLMLVQGISEKRFRNIKDLIKAE
jgi:competence protein ComEA